MKLKTRLFLAAGLNLGLAALIISVAWWGLAQLTRNVDQLVEQDWRKASMAVEVSDAANQVAHLVYQALAQPAQVQQYKAEIAAQRQRVEAILPKIEALLRLEKGRAMVKEIREKRQAFAETYPQVIALIEAGDVGAAESLFRRDGLPRLRAYLGAVNTFLSFHQVLFDENGKATQAVSEQARFAMVLLFVFVLAASSMVSLWLARGVLNPLGGEPDEASRAVARIADGDLSQPIVSGGNPHSLLSRLAAMQDSLRQMVSALHRDANTLNDTVSDLAAASEQVASGSRQQSEAAASMAAAVEELSASISHVSDSAGATRTQTEAADQFSQEGEAVIRDTVAEMGMIESLVRGASSTINEMGQRSQRISTVVNVIREVAEQTNLLALNAAIEAARAGETGRGFAVVADEVRKLAERTASATTEISKMILDVQSSVTAAVQQMEQSVEEVSKGVGKASIARESMHGIRHGTEQIIRAVGEISVALAEQNNAGLALSSNVENVAQMAEENNAAAAAAADTAMQLQTLSESVRTAAARFRL